MVVRRIGCVWLCGGQNLAPGLLLVYRDDAFDVLGKHFMKSSDDEALRIDVRERGPRKNSC